MLKIYSVSCKEPCPKKAVVTYNPPRINQNPVELIKPPVELIKKNELSKSPFGDEQALGRNFLEKLVTSIKDKGVIVSFLATLIEVTWCNGKMSKTETIKIVPHQNGTLLEEFPSIFDKN